MTNLIYNPANLTVTKLENQYSNLEELSKLDVTETCLDLKNYGLTISKEYDLDPDGLNEGQIPIKGKVFYVYNGKLVM